LPGLRHGLSGGPCNGRDAPPVVLKLANDEHCPHAERIARRGLYPPSGVGLTQDEADACAQTLREILV